MRAQDSSMHDGRTVVYLGNSDTDPQGHEAATHRAIARELAALKDCAYGGDYGGDLDRTRREGPRLFFVPWQTLTAGEAEGLQVRGEQDLFGGVVPHPFVASKVITHPLIDDAARAPEGWSSGFAQAVRNVTLPGYSVFAAHEALEAGRRLLAQGAVRVKQATGAAGLGQDVVRDTLALQALVGELEERGELAQGLVMEPNLVDIETYSVGRVRLGDMVVTYHGRQRQTIDNRGQEVYGGSDLVLVRGDFDILLAHDLPPWMQEVIRKARVYHAAALREYPGLFASRSNYDVARGRDASGEWHTGVLEQSWRVGGASGAELAGIAAFLRDSQLEIVHASTTEIYGDRPRLPDDAKIYYSGSDPRVGPLTKYAQLERNGRHT